MRAGPPASVFGYNRVLKNTTFSGDAMIRILCWIFILATAAFAQKSAAPTRPKITGIDHADFYTTTPDANSHLYTDVLGLASADRVEPGQIQRFMIGTQWVGYSPAPDPKATDRMDHLAFRTDDCEALRVYLASNGIKVPGFVTNSKAGRTFMVKDPEGHRIEFVQPSGMIMLTVGDPVSLRLIHAGFIVRDRATEDHFYKDILGFHLYWHGGMKDGDTDWAAMQVPDGTDWLEYMLNIEPHPDLQETGVQNHISLGVRDMKRAQAKLESHGWKPHDKDDHPEIGKDGKWQFDVFDPDFTRVELMEFKPVQKPCCSDFQGPHPSE
jgi:catechol 2,3-dioxygenase-like lactoylglutathione lyase family enzyme